MGERVLDLSEFHRRVATGERPTGAVGVQFKFAAPADTNSRTVTFRFSDNSVDSYGDTIDAAGWQWDKTNGVPALFGHDPSQVANVIGRGRNIRVMGNSLVGDIEFAEPDVNPVAETLLKMVRAGYITSVSVGFRPLEWKQAKDPKRQGGIDFTKQKLLEISVVPIGANENAIALAKAAGIDVARLGLNALPLTHEQRMAEVRRLAVTPS